MTDNWLINTKYDIKISTPADINLMTPYVLLEQEEWYEPEVHFVQSFLQPGMSALDIGACFGVYALPMARAVGPKGRVFAFEPAAQPRKHLKASAEENNLSNISIHPQALSESSATAKLTNPDTPELSTIGDQASSPAEDIQLTTLDAWWDQAERPDIDFIKLDAGHEGQIIQGGHKFFSKLSPIVLFSIKHSVEFHQEAAQALLDLGYSLYQYLPGPGILARFDHNAQPDHQLLNLLAVKPETAATLRDQGLIAPENLEVPEPQPGTWLQYLFTLPWTSTFLPAWHTSSQEQKYEGYLRALDFLCAAQDPQASPSQKLAQTQWAAQNLIQIYSQTPSPAIALTIARALQSLGQRQQAVQILEALVQSIQAEKHGDADLPFLPPLARFDHMPIQDSAQKWIMARCMESLIFLRSHSGYFSHNQDQKLLQTLHKNQEHTLESQRRLALIGLRQGKKVRIQRESPLLLNGEPNKNGWFWEHHKEQPRSTLSVSASQLKKSAEQDQTKPSIRILHQMARAGGTIISRCLGCMQDVVLLSEVHPLALQVAKQYGQTFNPLYQAYSWFGLFTQDEVAELERQSLSYNQIIKHIYERVEQQNKVLVLRDWSHLDFTGVPFVKSPSYEFSHAQTLQKDFDVIQTATVRHPIDQWLSLSKLGIIQGKLTVDQFMQGYLEFAENAADIGFIRYEDFAAQPAQAMTLICQRLAVPFDPDFREHWSEHHKITGDTSQGKLRKKEIKVPHRQSLSDDLLHQCERNDHYQEALEVLGYAHPHGIRPQEKSQRLPKVIATSVIRSAYQGQSHGGIYLVDLE